MSETRVLPGAVRAMLARDVTHSDPGRAREEVNDKAGQDVDEDP